MSVSHSFLIHFLQKKLPLEAKIQNNLYSIFKQNSFLYYLNWVLIQPSAERHGSDSQSRAVGTFSEVGSNSGVGGFGTWMKCWWGIGCKMGKNGGVRCGQNGWVGWQFSRGKWCHRFRCAKELNWFWLVEQRAERLQWAWFLGNVGMIGMEAASSDQSKAGGSKVQAVVVVGAKSVSWA